MYKMKLGTTKRANNCIPVIESNWNWNKIYYPNGAFRAHIYRLKIKTEMGDQSTFQKIVLSVTLSKLIESM